jgi:hypothetical protein
MNQQEVDKHCAECGGGFRFSGCPKTCEYYGKAFKDNFDVLKTQIEREGRRIPIPESPRAGKGTIIQQDSVYDGEGRTPIGNAVVDGILPSSELLEINPAEDIAEGRMKAYLKEFKKEDT